ncbi:hypothetical protein DFR52_106250 [Hoeflea marina]|uniref:Holin (3TMs family) n=1 Tax=Hoeflea marina TaxID=274592 RepID=A0A317PDK0_9HYPH|nr:hypothetical protein [Hoeflea marina]PWV97725.1 hypothetical protein DFR52_106250 [Hoeflea marina]
MSALAAILAGIAAEVGAPLIRKILEPKIGAAGGALAETVIKTIAEKAGVEPETLPEIEPSELEKAVRETEAEAPELIALYAAGLEGQFKLLASETREGFWPSAWRYGWMYLLAIFWIWRILIGPIVNQQIISGGGALIDMIDLATLLTLTSWFMALYMGGHTIKDFGKNVIDAVLKRGKA